MDDANTALTKDLQEILTQKTPLMPDADLQAFVGYYFSVQNKFLEAITDVPPPVYILESSVLQERAQLFRNAFEKNLPKVSFYYAVKSNNNPEVARILLASGFGLDVSSGLEMEMALDLGAPNMVFSGPGKTTRELRSAVTNTEKVIVLIDSLGELQRLESVAASQNKMIRAGVRLTTAAGLWRKFGIELDDLPAFWKEADQCSHVMLQGLQFHTSWNLTPKAQLDFIQILGKSLEKMPKRIREHIEFIDMGGGYWPSQGEWLQAAGTPAGRIKGILGENPGPILAHYRLPATPIHTFAEQLSAAIHKSLFNSLSCRIFLEPGRWICNDAMHLLISVVDKKAPDLVITDAGTNAIGWERFETDYFPILNLSRPSMKERRCNILGSLCTPHDVWGYSYWGQEIQPGDILMIPTQGAYTYSLRQNFIKPLPAAITI